MTPTASSASRTPYSVIVWPSSRRSWMRTSSNQLRSSIGDTSLLRRVGRKLFGVCEAVALKDLSLSMLGAPLRRSVVVVLYGGCGREETPSWGHLRERVPNHSD